MIIIIFLINSDCLVVICYGYCVANCGYEQSGKTFYSKLEVFQRKILEHGVIRLWCDMS